MRIPDVSAEAIGEVVESLSHRQPLSKQEVAEYLGRTKVYISSALTAAEQLGLVVRKDSTFLLTSQASDIVKTFGDQRRIAFKKALVRFDAFVTFAMFLARGNSIEEAARKVKVIFEIEDPTEIISKTLRSWGAYTRVLIKTKAGRYETEITAEELDEHYLKNLQDAIEDEMKARLFIASKLRARTFAFLSEAEKTYAVSAMLKHRTQPEDAVKDAEKCFESFLTRLAVADQVNISGVSGIEQLGNALKSVDSILEQHRKLCSYHAVFRNAADHALDKVTLKPWNIEADSALEIILSTLTAMRSMHSYVDSKDQIL